MAKNSFTAEDFIEPISIGPMKGLPSRLAAKANEMVSRKNAKASRELFFLSLELRGLGYLIENQDANGASPDSEDYWGIALLLKSMGLKARRIQRNLE